MSFTYENQGTNTYLVYKIEESDEIDTMSLGMITKNKIDGIIPTIFTQSDADKYIKYNITARVSAKEFLSGIVNKSRIVGVFTSILKAVQAAEEYMIDTSCLLIDLEYIYTDVSKCDAMLVCLPIIRKDQGNADLGMFFKQIMFSTQFDQSENCDYVAKIINYLNSSPVFSVDGFIRLLIEINSDSSVSKSIEQAVSNANKHPQQVQAVQNVVQQEKLDVPSQQKIQPQKNITQPKVEMNKSGLQIPQQSMKEQKINIPQSDKCAKSEASITTNSVGNEKQMTMFDLLTHYSKSNKEIYTRQKAMRKAQKEAKKQKTNANSNAPVPQQGFAIPGQSPQQSVSPIAQPVQKSEEKKVQQSQSVVQAVAQPKKIIDTNVNMGANPSVPPQILANMTKAGDFGETTVLGVSSGAGETTVLGVSQAQIVKPYLVRTKNNEHIELNKPVFRIGKERSYVDYFISDNTAISRSHVNIINKDNIFYIVDTNSTNHTYVNGTMIQSNVETKIEHGTKIKLANEEFEFFMY